MPKVLVSDELSETAVQIFRDRGVDVDYMPKLGKDKEKLAELIGQYDGLAIRSATKVTEKLLEQATNLKVVGRAGIGVDNVDIPAASKKGVIVMNTPFGNSITTAEHAIAMMFSIARQIPEANASTHAGKWEKSKFMGVELFNKTLGVIGAGNIGGIVCDRAVKREIQWCLEQFPKSQVHRMNSRLEQSVAEGIELVRDQLDPVERSPMLLFARHLAKTDERRGIVACVQNYRYKQDMFGVITNIPHKDNVFDHGCDALRMHQVMVHSRHSTAYMLSRKHL